MNGNQPSCLSRSVGSLSGSDVLPLQPPPQFARTRTRTTNTPRARSKIFRGRRMELELELERGAALQPRLDSADADLKAAQTEFDSAVLAYSLGHTTEPDRGELAACIAKGDALVRIASEQKRRISSLASELTARRVAEAVADNEARIGLLANHAESLLSEFAIVVAAARNIEKRLFTALFDESSGLKKTFATEALNREASRVRYDLKNRAEEIAAEHKYVIDPRFATDGELNLERESFGLYARTSEEVNHAVVTGLYHG